MSITENERILLEYLRSGVTFEQVSESHEACQLIHEVCEENKKYHGLELVSSNPSAFRKEPN